MTTSRETIDVDIACVGFGPATAGFLTTLVNKLSGESSLESKVMPGMPLQIVCYERSDDISFGVSGVVTKARSIRQSFSANDLLQIPMTTPVKHEKVVYLLDPIGASRRSKALKFLDSLMQGFKKIFSKEVFCHAIELPYIPDFLKKDGGFIFSIGQFNSWVASRLMATGLVQIWPSMPVSAPIIEDKKVTGVQLTDQGTDKSGKPTAGYTAGMNIKAGLTVVGDGPIGAVGQKLNEHFGLPPGHHQRDWAIGMKILVELPKNCNLQAGTVIHTIGFPEPEIFGFFYVYQDGLASIGIFVPSFFDSPVRTTYRYLQHWMMHPYLWQYLQGGTLRSWGAKSLQESGKRGEPYLVGDGFARIGEGSGSTNMLTGSGVDEAWETGVQLAHGVIDLLKKNKPFTKENLEEVYLKPRRKSWVEKEGQIAEKARDGFQKGFLTGLLGMGITGLTKGKINLGCEPKRPYERILPLEKYYRGKVSKDELEKILEETRTKKIPLHNILMEKAGWPKIPYDGKLLVSHQDALLMGGKVQAPAGYGDHVIFLYPLICEKCKTKICIEGCSGQAIMPGENGGIPAFDREKCVYCGACLWNCAHHCEDNPEKSNIKFTSGAGGLHSSIN